ncbi:restriction endonuclease subunit S [Clostridium baratii]|uniref:Restriction endonuclease subunit S n=1 Tax=Clostridium nitritogenes TaxID=83340 RepID=A0ABN1LT96_9CLOT
MKKEVREGYKMTELGEIPEEWEVKRLRDLGSSVIGLTYSPDDLVEDSNATLVLRSSNIRNSRIVFDDNKYVNKDIREKLIVKENDILLCSRNGSKDLIGKCALIDKKTEGSSFGAFMTVYRSEYNKYLFNVFTSYMFKRQIYNNLGATINQITTDNLNNFKVILPTVEEQEKISSILLTVDEQIDNTEKLIQKNQELKKGLMQQLLTKGIGHTKFKKTEIGEIPEEWEVKKLKELTDVLRCGVASTPTYVEKGIPFLSAQNVQDGKISLHKYNYISEEYHKKLTKNDKPQKGDILYSRVGANYGIAAVVEVEFEFSIYVSLTLIRIKKEYNSVFYKYLLNSEFIRKQADVGVFQGGGVPNLNVKVVEKFNMIVPPKFEQDRIASILSTVDEKIEQYKNKKEKLEEVKKGLMQQLLTGNIRVV